jgi:hypothetical protein
MTVTPNTVSHFGISSTSGDVKTLPLPARSPNLNAFAERWVKSVKDESLSKHH